jgi:hypothetical protein
VKRRLNIPRTVVLLAIAAFVAPSVAGAQSMRIVNGQAYWRGDPGPIDPGAFWTGGEFQYDPQHYLGSRGSDAANYLDVVYADHAGKERCVWRKRVVNSNWDFQHPYLRVCRN